MGTAPPSPLGAAAVDGDDDDHWKAPALPSLYVKTDKGKGGGNMVERSWYRKILLTVTEVTFGVRYIEE